MELTLRRIALRPTYTIGRLYIGDQQICDTLEDRVRNLAREPKIPGQTAIPPGRYEVVFTYSPKFRRKMPRLLNVPHFDGILIHPGNTEYDTAGCILTGRNTIVGRLTASAATFEPLRLKIEQACARGKVFITITNPD